MAAAYGHGGKRPKVKEPTRVEATEYFQDRVEYNSEASTTDSLSYRHYNSAERVFGKTLEEWLRLAVSLTAFRSDGSDWIGKPTFTRPWDDHTHSTENYKRSARACFEFCAKLGLKYWTAFDSDLVPWSDSTEEYRSNWEEMTEFLQDNGQKTHVKPLWIAPDLHSHARFASGAATSYDASIFMKAASQVKKSLELAQLLNSECFLIWPIREGYDAIFKSDVPREMKLFAKLLKMAADFKDRIQYKGQLMIMPYYGQMRQNYWDRMYENDLNRYMWDATSCLYFLKNFNLDRSYKVCVPPGHQMFLANVYNMLGGVTIDNSMSESDNRTMVLMMKSMIDQGSVLPGGTTLTLTPRRQSVDPRDLLSTYVGRIDSLARALKTASMMVNEQLISKWVQQRYSSYYSGSGARLAGAGGSGDVTLEECEEHAKKNHQNEECLKSSRSEHWETAFRRYCDITEQRC